MSTTENHNDDLFRNRLESYREMPSDKVWAGIENALDKDKKKRKFIIWWWTGGIGISTAALVAAVFLFTYIPSNTSALTVQHKAKNKPVKASEIPQSDAQTTSVTSARVTTNATEQSVTKRVDKKQNRQTVSASFQPSQNLSAKTTADGSRTKTTVETNATIPSNLFLDTKEETVLAASSNNEQRGNARSESTVRTNEELTPVLFPISFSSEYKPVERTYQPAPFNVIPVAPKITPYISVQGYSGAVGYRRKSQPTNGSNVPTNSLDQGDTSTPAKQFGLYAATSIKAGILLNNKLYVSVGIGYETQRFSGNQSFVIPSLNSSIPPNGTEENIPTNTSFGVVNYPLQTSDLLSASQTLNGRLVYQNHHLFFPIDIGYRFQHKNISVNLGAVAAFHVPLSQSAVFYSNQGDVRTLKLNKAVPLNFSIGFEPTFEYRFAKVASIMAGGTFRYSLLNAYQSKTTVSHPYVLAGNLGFRFYLR